MTKYIEREIDFRPGNTEVLLVETRVPIQVANFAKEISKHLAIAAAHPDGEDSAGRQRMRLLTPVEAAARSCDIAEAVYREFDQRGWMLDIPEPKVEPRERVASLASRRNSEAKPKDA